MNVISQSFIRSLVAVAAMTLAATQAQAETYSYSQSFGAFGSVSGQFSGTDTDGDGLLSDTEVTFQSLNFSGGLGSLSYTGAEINISTFQWVVGDVGMISNPSSGFNLVGFPDSATGLALDWTAGEGAGLNLDEGHLYLYQADTNAPEASLNAIAGTTVSPVPEPESYLMMALGLVGLVAAKRRQRV